METMSVEQLKLLKGRVWGKEKPSPVRVRKLRQRYERGLDLWTGLPLTGRAKVESEAIREVQTAARAERKEPSPDALVRYSEFQSGIENRDS